MKLLAEVTVNARSVKPPTPLINTVASDVCKTAGPAATFRVINKHIYGISSGILEDTLT